MGQGNLWTPCDIRNSAPWSAMKRAGRPKLSFDESSEAEEGAFVFGHFQVLEGVGHGCVIRHWIIMVMTVIDRRSTKLGEYSWYWSILAKCILKHGRCLFANYFFLFSWTHVQLDRYVRFLPVLRLPLDFPGLIDIGHPG